MVFHNMKALIFLTTTMLLLTGFYISPSFIVAVFGVFTSLLLLLLTLVFGPYFMELMSTDNRPPVVGPIFNLLIHFQQLYDYMTSIAKKHTTFRFIRPTHSEVYTTDPVNVEYILKTNFENYTKGEYNTCIMKDLFGNGIFAVDGAKWRHQRKLASFEFSTKVLRDFSSVVFKSNTAKLVKHISLLAAAENAMDFQDLLMKSTLDSMFKVGFGFDLDTLSGLDEASNQFMKAFDDSNALVYWRFMDLLWKGKRYLSIGSEATLKDNIRIIDSFLYNLIHNKREQMKNENHYRNKEDILSRFLMESENDPENMNDKYLRDISLSFVIAGKDTSANTLTWFFYMLCKHPLIQQKIAEEVKTATEADDDTSIDEFGLKLTQVALDKMHYLHAAISETLRLYPAVPLESKSAEKDDVLPDGFKIKKGDGVGYIPYPMGRMTYIWGDDAEEFRPERWLDNGIFRPESPFKFTAFQGGPRICLGKEFAYRQMKILAAYLVYFFKFKLVDEGKDATYRTMFTLHMDFESNADDSESDEESDSVKPRFSSIKKASGVLDKELSASGFSKKEQDDIEKFTEKIYGSDDEDTEEDEEIEEDEGDNSTINASDIQKFDSLCSLTKDDVELNTCVEVEEGQDDCEGKLVDTSDQGEDNESEEDENPELVERLARQRKRAIQAARAGRKPNSSRNAYKDKGGKSSHNSKIQKQMSSW